MFCSYDALLGCGGDWVELCHRGMLHGGDNDSTGCIAGAWFGALYGFNSVPKTNYLVTNTYLQFIFLSFSIQNSPTEIKIT